MSSSVRPYRPELTRPLCLWDSPGKNTGVGCHFLLQGIFLTRGSNPGLLHCRRILYQLRYQGSTRILEWVVISFSTASSPTPGFEPVSLAYPALTGRFFTPSATWKPWVCSLCANLLNGTLMICIRLCTWIQSLLNKTVAGVISSSVFPWPEAQAL